MSPSFGPDVDEQRRFFSDRRTKPIDDGFHITDGSRVVAVDGQSRSDYDKMIKDNFKYTHENRAEAHKEAARTGRPIVEIFGGFENNNSRSLVQNALKQAEGGAAKDAIFIYNDRAKLKDGPLAAYADGQFAGGHNATVSLVYSVKPGKDGKGIEPEVPTFRWQGSDASMIEGFNQSIAQAHEKMQGYKGKFDLAEGSAEKAEKKGTPGERIAGARDAIEKALKAAGESKDWHQAERLYRTAYKEADKVDPADIKAEHQRIQQELDSTPIGSLKHGELLKQSQNLSVVESSKWSTRAALGVACMRWANDQPEDLQHQFRDIGSDWIKAAARRNPAIYADAKVIAQIKETGIPADELKKLLPDLAEKPKDLYEFGGDGKKKDNPATAEQPPAEVKPPEVKPPEVVKPEMTAEEKEAERKKIIEEDEKKAVKTEKEYNDKLLAAAKAGKAVIIKIGSTTCGPCHDMAPSLKEAEAELAGQAVVIRVLYENTPELAEKLGADKGVPITKVAAVKTTANGPELVEFNSKLGFSNKPDELKKFISEGMSSYEAWKRAAA